MVSASSDVILRCAKMYLCQSLLLLLGTVSRPRSRSRSEVRRADHALTGVATGEPMEILEVQIGKAKMSITKMTVGQKRENYTTELTLGLELRYS